MAFTKRSARRLRSPAQRAPFWAAFVHMLRNSDNHGIESPEEAWRPAHLPLAERRSSVKLRLVAARALILDVGHRFIAFQGTGGAWEPPSAVPRTGERSLATLNAMVLDRIGLALPPSIGVRPRGAPDDFAFILPPGARIDSTDARWFALPELARLEAFSGMWPLYVDGVLGGWEPPTAELDVFYFGADARAAASLAHLVVKGHKRATALWPEVARLKGVTIPKPGLISVVTDGFGIPACAIQTERIDELRFSDIDESCARDEGEGDGSLEDWRDGHRRYFTREGAELGLTFGDNTLVMVERFRLLKSFGQCR